MENANTNLENYTASLMMIFDIGNWLVFRHLLKRIFFFVHNRECSWHFRI